MAEGIPWSVRGVEPDIRCETARAAQTAGMTIGQWLNGVLRDTLVDLRAARPSLAGHQFSQQEMASPMPPFQMPYPYAPHPGYAPPPAAPYAGPPYAQPYPPQPVAYDPYAQPAPYYPRSYEPPRPPAPQPHPSAHDDRLASVLEALSGIVDRARQPAPVPAPAPEPVPARPVPAQDPDLAGQLDALMKRLASLETSLAERRAPARDPLIEARDAEERLGDALGELGTAPAGVRPPPRVSRPRIGIARGGAAAAVADIAARQRALDMDAAPRAMAEDERHMLEQIRRAISALSEQVRETKVRPAEDRDGLRDELAGLRTAIQDAAPRRIVASVNESIRSLADRIQQSRDNGAFETQLAPIEALLSDIRTTVAQPRGLDSVNQRLAEIARRIDALGSGAATGPAIGELQIQLRDLREAVTRSQDRPGLDVLARDLGRLSVKLDELAARPTDNRITSAIASSVEQLRNDLGRFDPERLAATIDRRLSGLDDLGRRIDDLATRIDEAEHRPAGQVHVDALTRQIERMTDTLGRQGTPDISDLAGRIESMREAVSMRPVAVDLSSVEQRIADVQSLLERKIPTQPDVKGLEMILRKLAERVETARAPAAGSADLDALQNQIVMLAERLDRAGSAPDLSGIEHSFRDLMQAVDGMRDSAARAAQDAVRDALAQGGGSGGMDPLAAEGLVLIKRDLTEMKTSQAAAEQRSRDTLQSVGSMLEKIVTRLSSLETDLQKQPVRSAAPEPAPLPAPGVAMGGPYDGRTAPQLARAPEPVIAARDMRSNPGPAPMRPAALEVPVGTDHGLDLPIEPGAARAADPSEAAAPADPRSAFIAAARRAAQGAAQQTTAALAEVERKGASKLKDAGVTGATGALGAIKATLAARRKPILLGLAVVFIIIGGLRIATTLLVPDEPLPKPTTQLPTQSSSQRAAPAGGENAGKSTQAIADQASIAPDTTASIDRSPAAIPTPPVATQPAMAPQLVPTTPPRETTDVATLMKQTNFNGPERLKQAAQNGNNAAIYEIGSRYAEGRGVGRDLKNAGRWFEQAASQGHAPSQYRFASFHREGLGVPVDAKTAFVWFLRAAEQGHVLAMHNLGVLYAEGVTGSPDYASAAGWFRNAAEHGVKDSQFNIAILHVRGLGVAQDMVEAYKWFALAAGQGDADGVKRREEVAARLKPEQLAEAKEKFEEFRAKRADTRVNDVAAPEGGWDGTGKAGGAAKRTRT